MNIQPGTGIGNCKYGISEEELISLLGKPDRIIEDEYVEGQGDWSRELWYSPRNITFTFNQDDEFRLGGITVMGSGYPLFSKDLFSLSLKFVKSFLSKKVNEIPKYCDHSYLEHSTHECLSFDKLGMLFWFDDDNLSEIQCSYLFEEDNETVIWPTAS